MKEGNVLDNANLIDCITVFKSELEIYSDLPTSLNPKPGGSRGVWGHIPPEKFEN